MNETGNNTLNSSQYVRISIEHQVEGNNWDYITIYSVDNDNNLVELIVINTPNLTTTLIESDYKNGKLVVNFHTDASVRRKGFKATVSTIDEKTIAAERWEAFNHTFMTAENDQALYINNLGNVGFGCDPGSEFVKFNRTTNPNILLDNTVNSLVLGVSSIYQGFARYAQPNDAVIRTRTSSLANALHLHFNNTTNDGNSKITFGDQGDTNPFMSILNNNKIAVGHTSQTRKAMFSIDGALQATSLSITDITPRGLVDLGYDVGVNRGLFIGEYIELNELEGINNAGFIGFNVKLASSSGNSSADRIKPHYAGNGSTIEGTGVYMKMLSGGAGDLDFYGINWKNDATPREWGSDDIKHIMRLNSDGSVGINTFKATSSGEYFSLSVGGKIRAEELVVELESDWPDYVFSNEYKLRSLSELQQFIEQHGHLPEVPNAETVSENGVGLGEMNGILLKKIEELTLYILELENKLNELEKSVKEY